MRVHDTKNIFTSDWAGKNIKCSAGLLSLPLSNGFFVVFDFVRDIFINRLVLANS